MRQTTLSVPLEVKPESADRLSALIDALRHDLDLAGDPARPNFKALLDGLPTLHFLSMSVFPGHDYDPIFIIEANFDGEPGVFWGQFETLLGDRLRPMLRCCKRPFDGSGPLYDAAIGNPARPAVAFLEAQVQQPSVFFHGNRGLSRDRILSEHALFLATRAELDDPARTGPNPYRAGTAAALHRRLREAMLVRFPALASPAPPRITRGETITDFARLIAFLVAVLLALSLPGLILAPLMSWQLYMIITVIGASLVGGLLWHYHRALGGAEPPARVKFKLINPLRVVVLAVAVAAYAALATALLSGVVGVIHLISRLAERLGIGHTIGLVAALHSTFWAVVLGLASIAVTLPALILLLRWNELRDSSQDAPPVDDAVLREMVRREDWIMQNHMGSIVLIKPGILRSLIVRAGHYGLGLFLRVSATDGYLGSMRTVHFAHWAFLNNGSRLLFFSNFDHSWGSYLDDFIEKSHSGLTLAWGAGVGFPRTRLLVLDGASHGRQFKTWALASRTVSRFWYSAYRDLTVDQIERNFRIATGLREATMTEAQATQWALDL